MKILITGICGFVGSAIASAWIEQDTGIKIYGIDNLSRRGSETNLKILREKRIDVFHGDIRIASDVEGLPRADWVIDASANPSVLAGVKGTSGSRQVIENNLAGTVNVLEFCKKKAGGLIFISTNRVYSVKSLADVPLTPREDRFCPRQDEPLPPGMTNNGINESFSTEPPLSLYGSSKLASELLVLEYGDLFGFPVLINRCGIMAGAGQFGLHSQGILTYWINAWLHSLPLCYCGFGGKGLQVRDCFHPKDLVPLLKKQMSGKASVRRVNIGGGIGNSFSLAGLSSWCSARFGPRSVSSDYETRAFDVPWLVMDSGLVGQTWGWKPAVSLNSILDEIAEHAEKNPDWLKISGAL